MSLLSIVLLTGCAPTLMQTARTAGEGNVQVGIEGGVGGWVGSGGNEQDPEGGAFVYPTFNVAGRYGLTDRIDIGGRIGTIGYGLQAKFAVTDPDLADVLIAVVPEVSVMGLAGVTTTRMNLGALFGIPVGDHELTIGALSSNNLTFVDGSALFTSNVGASAGFALRVSDQIRFMPEVSFKPLVLGAIAADGTGFGGALALPTWSASMGVLVGGD